LKADRDKMLPFFTPAENFMDEAGQQPLPFISIQQMQQHFNEFKKELENMKGMMHDRYTDVNNELDKMEERIQNQEAFRNEMTWDSIRGMVANIISDYQAPAPAEREDYVPRSDNRPIGRPASAPKRVRTSEDPEPARPPPVLNYELIIEQKIESAIAEQRFEEKMRAIAVQVLQIKGEEPSSMPLDPPAHLPGDPADFNRRLQALEQLFANLYDPAATPFSTPSAPPPTGDFRRPPPP
jgi:hypothetical protein